MHLGPLDVQILQLLQDDARLSFRELADRLGSTTPTISARVKSLEDIGILRGYRAELDPSLLGGVGHLLTVTVHPKAALEAHAAVLALPGARAAFLLPGGRVVAHLILRPPTYGLAQLDQAVADIAGLQSYGVSEVLQSHVQVASGNLPENLDVPCHQCHGPIHADPIKGKFGARTHVFCCRQCLAEFRERYESLEAAAAGASKRGTSKTGAKRPAKAR